MPFKRTNASSSSSASTPSTLSSVTPTSTSPSSAPPTNGATSPAQSPQISPPHRRSSQRDEPDPALPRKLTSGITHRTTILPPPEPPKLHEVPRRSPFGALLSRTLPHYTGPHPVGVSDVEIPVARQTFGTFRHKSMPEASAGLAMDTVMFSLFYPCELPEKPAPVVWFPKLSQTIDGFLKMAKRTPNVWYRMIAYPIAAAAIHGTTFPAAKDAPLAVPPETPSDPSSVPYSAHISTPQGNRWPLMVFSHGVGCSRLMYSAFCGEMASRGYVVAVLEHRDGTSPSSTIAAADGTTTIVDWVQWSDLFWPELDEQPTDDTKLRHEQIKFRIAEVEAVIDVMNAWSKGETLASKSGSVPDFDRERWRFVDTSRPVMAGHSLGGSAALAASSKQSIDFRSVIVFDPAVQRLEPWVSPLPHPLLVVNSEEFTVGREYTIFSEQMARTATTELQVYSIGGATHPSFSDVFLILPTAINRLTGLAAPPASVIARAVRAAEQFLGGAGGHGGRVSYEEEYRDEEDRRGKMGVGVGVGGRGRGGVRSLGRRRFGRKARRIVPEGEGEGAGEGERGKGGKLYRPIGKPGQLAWHRL